MGRMFKKPNWQVRRRVELPRLRQRFVESEYGGIGSVERNTRALIQMLREGIDCVMDSVYLLSDEVDIFRKELDVFKTERIEQENTQLAAQVKQTWTKGKK